MLRDVERLASLGRHVAQHEDELVAADARDESPWRTALEAAGHGEQEVVAEGVAEGVVDELEAVEVEEEKGRRGAVRGGSRF